MTVAPFAFTVWSCSALISTRPVSTQYVIVRRDLPLGVMAAQVAHAAGSQAPHPPDSHVVILAVDGETSLRALAERLPGSHLVIETDAPFTDQAMAIGCPLVTDRTAIRKEVSSLPLLR